VPEGRRAKGSEARKLRSPCRSPSGCYARLTGAAAGGVRALRVIVPIRRGAGCVTLGWAVAVTCVDVVLRSRTLLGGQRCRPEWQQVPRDRRSCSKRIGRMKDHQVSACLEQERQNARAAAKLLTRDEARQIAAKIAKLPQGVDLLASVCRRCRCILAEIQSAGRRPCYERIYVDSLLLARRILDCPAYRP
jgi:hypothetical protein